MTKLTAVAVHVANEEQGKHVEGSHLESGMAGTLQFSVDGAMMHQGGCRGVDELRQPTGQAASSMQPPLLCTRYITHELPCLHACMCE